MRNLTIFHWTNSGKDLVRDQVLLLTVCIMSYGMNHLLRNFLRLFSTDDFSGLLLDTRALILYFRRSEILYELSDWRLLSP